MWECERRKRGRKGRCGTGVLRKEERGQEGPRDAKDRAWFFLALQRSLHAYPVQAAAEEHSFVASRMLRRHAFPAAKQASLLTD